MKIQYSSSTSGGNWRLRDEDWFALEKAGWKVEWEAEKKESILRDKDGKRFLGALACNASKDFETPAEAMKEFEKITGQDVSDDGCGCCTPPHTFRWGRSVDATLPETVEYGYASGLACLKYLFKKVPKSLREAVEKINDLA